MRTLLFAVLMLGCGARSVGYDAEASAAYRAAWDKKMAGDEAGYRASLEAVTKKYPNTRAGERAKERLAAK
jgi:hypothetical protein